MERVPLPVFVDFVLASSMRRLDVLKPFKNGRHRDRPDFYDPLRACIIDMHRKRLPPSTLSDASLSSVGKRQAELYPALINGYERFLSSAPMQWFEPPHTVLPIGDLEIDIRPDLGFEIGGTPHLITLYFRGAEPSQPRITTMLGIITAALGPTRPGTVFSILDVKMARLHTLKKPQPRLGLAVRADAAAFATIYAAV